MNKIQFKAFFITCIIMATAAYFLLGKPSIDFTKQWEAITSYFEGEYEGKESKKTKKKYSNKSGVKVDSYKGVVIYDNGRVGNVSGRNVTADGYNLGLKYQCVEFVKRFYYEYFNHKMPDSYGHAKDFFDYSIADGGYSKKRGLTQFTQNSSSKPKVNDLIIFGGTPYNQFGHVAIISKVSSNQIEIVQQNPGKGNSSRATYSLSNTNGKWAIGNQYVLGWLRK